MAFNRYLEKRHAGARGLPPVPLPVEPRRPGALCTSSTATSELFRLAALLQLTVERHSRSIYYGEEVGRAGGDWPDNRSDMPWGERDIAPGAGVPRDEELRDDYRRLIAIRRAHPALWRGDHAGVHFDPDLLVFLRSDARAETRLLVAVNRGAEEAILEFELPAKGGPAASCEMFGATSPCRSPGASCEWRLPARSARILASAGGG